jgi:uncharacterized protein YciI
MPLFAIRCTDAPGALKTRLETRPVHLEYLNGRSEIRLAGALLDDAGTPIGSLVIVETDDLGAAREIAEQDPFTAAGVFAQVEVLPWRLAIGAIPGEPISG